MCFFFKTLLKENYVIALDSCYMFTQKTWNMELNMALIVHSIDIPDFYSSLNEYLGI